MRKKQGPPRLILVFFPITLLKNVNEVFRRSRNLFEIFALRASYLKPTCPKKPEISVF
jgi:hypothetical protein